MSGPRWTSGILHEYVDLIFAPLQVDDFVVILDSPSLCLRTRVRRGPCQLRSFQNFDGLDGRSNSEAFGQGVGGRERGPYRFRWLLRSDPLDERWPGLEHQWRSERLSGEWICPMKDGRGNMPKLELRGRGLSRRRRSGVSCCWVG